MVHCTYLGAPARSIHRAILNTVARAGPGSAQRADTNRKSNAPPIEVPDGHVELQRRGPRLALHERAFSCIAPQLLGDRKTIGKHRAGAGSGPGHARREPLRHPDALTHRSPFRSCATSSAADALPSTSRQASSPRRVCTSVAIGRMPVGADTQIRRAASASDGRAEPCHRLRPCRMVQPRQRLARPPAKRPRPGRLQW